VRIAESGLPGLRGVAAPLVCVVTGREKLSCEKWSIMRKERHPLTRRQMVKAPSKEWDTALSKSEAAVRRIEHSTVREGECVSSKAKKSDKE
jgi:hypothetical protein